MTEQQPTPKEWRPAAKYGPQGWESLQHGSRSAEPITSVIRKDAEESRVARPEVKAPINVVYSREEAEVIRKDRANVW